MTHEVETVSIPLDLSQFSGIIDVRTPLEFAEDHLPGALNLPVLDNDQRAEVGTLYKRSAFQARRLGASYVSRNIANHLSHGLNAHESNWNPLLYCWRGGMRSKSFAAVLRSVGWRARVLEGGYKAWRGFLREDLDRLLDNSALHLHVIAGLTGTGKTRLLKSLVEAGAQVLDLEGLANHRGSLLGTVGEQPSQKRFESLLHDALGRFDPARPIFAEAESNRIGSAYLPPALWRKLGQADVTEITLDRSERVKLLLEDYEHFPRDPAALSALLDRLRSLRGHDLVDSWQEQIASGSWPVFVESILTKHYDLCYRRPGAPDSVYQEPARQIELPDASPGSFASAAARLAAGSAGALQQ